MKTTKRLLSILLMLTMLVSMFTVMAFADGTFNSVTVDLKIVNADDGKNGKVIYTGTKEEITQNTTIGTFDDRGFVAEKGSCPDNPGLFPYYQCYLQPVS